MRDLLHDLRIIHHNDAAQAVAALNLCAMIVAARFLATVLSCERFGAGLG
jgi:hypothetical protein